MSLRGGEPGPSMEALVRVGGRNTQPFVVLWRRFGLATKEPVAVAGDEGELREP